MEQAKQPLYYRGRHRIKRRTSLNTAISIRSDKVEIDSGEDYVFAGFWMRFWAFLLDLVAVVSIQGLIVYPLFRVLHIDSITFLTYELDVLVAALVFFLYFAIMTKVSGQTIGKIVFGLCVVSKDGTRLTWGQVLFREGVGRFIHEVFFFLKLLYFVVAFTSNKQGIHDLLAETYVVHTREK